MLCHVFGADEHWMAGCLLSQLVLPNIEARESSEKFRPLETYHSSRYRMYIIDQAHTVGFPLGLFHYGEFWG